MDGRAPGRAGGSQCPRSSRPLPVPFDVPPPPGSASCWVRSGGLLSENVVHWALMKRREETHRATNSHKPCDLSALSLAHICWHSAWGLETRLLAPALRSPTRQLESCRDVC